jgi:hypothetical protein
MKDISDGDDGSPALNTDDATVPGTISYSDSPFGMAMGHAIATTFGAIPQSRGDGWRAARGAKSQAR